MTAFNSDAHRYWQQIFGFSDQPEEDDPFSIRIAESLPTRHSLLKMARDDGKTFIAATTACADKLSLSRTAQPGEVLAAMAEHQLCWYDDDAVYYFPMAVQSALPLHSDHADIRQLSLDDADAFNRFKAQMPEDDWDEVEPELDNEAVFGHFKNKALCCVADFYRWQQSPFADIGVLTAPECRGQGIGAGVVRILSGHAVAKGLIPQYRAQLSNQSSLKITERLGMQRYGLWTVAVAKP